MLKNDTYFDRELMDLVQEPYCDGICYQYNNFGVLLQEDNVNPCLACTGLAGCSSCKQGSFGVPDSYQQYRYAMPAVVTACVTCGHCERDNCGLQGCSACLEGGAGVRVAGSLSPTDPLACITELCEDKGDTFMAPINVNRTLHMPASLNLWSYAPHCKESGSGRACDPQTGCTECDAGRFLARHPLVVNATLCQRCEGCPPAQCSGSGCTSCPVLGLGMRAVLAEYKNATGGAVYACRNSSLPQAFRGRGSPGLPDTALWPVSEFGGCGPDVGEVMWDWRGNNSEHELAFSSWFDQDLQTIDLNCTTLASLTLNFTSRTRVTVTLAYQDAISGRQRVHKVTQGMPAAQDRVCITVRNQVTTIPANARMAAQLTVVNNAGKKVLLRFDAQPSLTPRPNVTTGVTFAGGGFTVRGRDGVIASPTRAVQWLNGEKLIILPAQAEWQAFTPKPPPPPPRPPPPPPPKRPPPPILRKPPPPR